jgi:peptidoglycan-associated lipoprotein
MRHPGHLVALAAVLALMTAAVGCARRPTVGEFSAPAPGGLTAAPAAPREAAAVPPVPAPPLAAPPAPAWPARPRPTGMVARPEVADVYFDFDRSEIRPDAARTLDASAAWLVEHPGYAVLIEGHCDERGTNTYNLALGDRRAHAARTYLASRGVAISRLRTISYGEERPVCTDRVERCWAKNRRAHFLLKPE